MLCSPLARHSMTHTTASPTRTVGTRNRPGRPGRLRVPTVRVGLAVVCVRECRARGEQSMSVVREVLGYPMLAATMSEVVDLCEGAIVGSRPIQIGVMNAAKVVNAARDAGLHEAILSCDVILADGQSVVWASRMLGQPLPERVAGIDLFIRLLELADKRHLSVFLLGATPEVVEQVADVVGTKYPGARLVGHRDGYFDDEESVAQEIASSHPDMLFLGMTSPKKEKFLDCLL